MVTQNLVQLTEEVKKEYSQLHSYVVPTKGIKMTEAGYLSTGKNEFPFTLDGLDQFARSADIPKQFIRRLPIDLRAIVFNQCFEMVIADGKLPRDIRINLNKDMQIVGFDDSSLLRISPVKLMEQICSSLPGGLTAGEIDVARFASSPKRIHLSCFSPEIISEPRPGDIINGGIDLIHYLAGDQGTQVFCYLRRLVCKNGAITHVCGENKHLRARRLHNGRFDEADMLSQIHRLLKEAWAQLQEKLDAVKGLLEKERIPMDFLRQQRTKFSLNDRTLKAIERAIQEDEFGSTNSQYDVFSALSSVATHDENLSFRQQRTLSRMAGEFSQQTVHRCDKCGQWVVQEN
jgi:hypothetical protein